MSLSALIDRQGLTFSGRDLSVGNRTLKMPYTILDAGRFASGIAVVFDYMEFDKSERCENLWAIDLEGNRVWIAEAPDVPANAYVSLISTQPLKAWNFACYICTLEPECGRLIEAEFAK
ncbi:hypothetical protein E4K72_08055 [Oxalobacteraceae bacterium OM1]|nr:hypothetical protein E4K72_08055 [Oxalobacteraceae bacterium OM1]